MLTPDHNDTPEGNSDHRRPMTRPSKCRWDSRIGEGGLSCVASGLVGYCKMIFFFGYRLAATARQLCRLRVCSVVFIEPFSDVGVIHRPLFFWLVATCLDHRRCSCGANVMFTLRIRDVACSVDDSRLTVPGSRDVRMADELSLVLSMLQ